MKRKKLLLIGILAFSFLACTFERVMDPSLPTNTPELPPTTPTPPVPPTFTPIPTPEPGARVESGDQAFFNGDWEKAITEYTLALETNTDPEIKAAALLGLGRAHHKSGNQIRALESLNTLIATYPDSPHQAAAFFALGEVYESLDNYPQAADSFQNYLNLHPGLIDFYVYDRIGDNKFASGAFNDAISNYQVALQSPYIGDALYINIKIGDSYEALGDIATSLVVYEDVLNRTNNDFVKAQMKRYIGWAYIALGQPDEGFAAYLDAVLNYPLSYDSYLALMELVSYGYVVDDLSRGVVNYFAGEYGFAIDAFVRHLNANPDSHSDTPHYYLGLAYRIQGNYEAAINEWQLIINDHYDQRFWADAYDEIAYTQWVNLNKYNEAIQTLELFLQVAPEHPKAPEFLYYAGRIAERSWDLEKAAKLWERVGLNYSTSDWAYEGLFQAGIAKYRLGNYNDSITHFSSALGVARDLGEQARAHFWVGKSFEKLGEHEAAYSSWVQASTSDPTGYYSERALDLIEGRKPFTPPASYSFDYDKAAEKAEAEAWMLAIFGITEDVNLADYSSLFLDSRFVRGTELWNLGLYNQARGEFESYRLDVQNDPANTYRLANYLIDLGLNRSGIFAARRVLDLAGYDDAGTFSAPVYFNRLRFGTYFSELVVPAAEAYGLDPFYMFSVMRQESLFEGFVTSTAGARGLMQIIPATGKDIRNRNGWPPNYTSDDLYRPLVSLTYGAYYLDLQKRNFNNDLHIALAAYNAGPNKAAQWMPLIEAFYDPDLFVEVIRFSETRNYIRYIYEIFTIYRKLYEVIP